MHYEVGQSVFVGRTNLYTRRDRDHGGHMLAITKIGRKWATLENGSRFELDTGIVDYGEYTSEEKVFESEGAYRDALFAERLWSDFKQRVVYTRPPSIEEIFEIASTLDIELDDTRRPNEKKDGE